MRWLVDEDQGHILHVMRRTRTGAGALAQCKMAEMWHTLRFPILGALVAIGVTSSMDATGYFAFSALPLLPLIVLFAWIERLPPRRMGFAWAASQTWGLAILYPVLVLGAIAVLAAAAGAIDTGHTQWKKAALNLLLIGVSTFLIAILTEEGFFRGWLFASLERAGLRPSRVILWSSIAFALWHLSAISLPTGYDVPAARIPLFLVNAAVIGAIWGMLRQISGSLIVTSVSHGLWNAGDYVLFGFGTRSGALGVQNTALWGPEVGVLGLTLNIAFAILLWRRWRLASAVPEEKAIDSRGPTSIESQGRPAAPGRRRPCG